MKRFEDANGKEWFIDLDVPTLRNIKRKFDIDFLLPLVDPKEAETAFNIVGSDVDLMLEILFYCCSEQAEKQGVDQDTFVRGLNDSDKINAAFYAFMEDYIPFFQKEIQTAMTKWLNQMKEQREKMSDEEKDRRITDMLEIETLKMERTDLETQARMKAERKQLTEDIANLKRSGVISTA